MRWFSFILILVVFHSQTSLAKSVVLDRLEATVNSSIVLLSHIRRFRKTLDLRAQLDPLFSSHTIASKGKKASNSEIVSFLIDEAIIEQQFPVSDADVEQEINLIQANNQINRAGLKSALKGQGFDFSEYFELIRKSTAKRNLIDRDIRTKVYISEDDLKNYFYNHMAKGDRALREYQIKIITITPGNYKSAAAARSVAKRAHEALVAKEPFEEVASRFSDSPNAKTGAELGKLTEDQMSPLIRKALKGLKIGDFSRILGDGKSQFFILKLEDIVSSESNRFKQVRNEIRARLTSTEYQHQIQLWLDRKRQNAFVHRSGKRSRIPGIVPNKRHN